MTSTLRALHLNYYITEEFTSCYYGLRMLAKNGQINHKSKSDYCVSKKNLINLCKHETKNEKC